jgi:hypothetical protein
LGEDRRAEAGAGDEERTLFAQRQQAERMGVPHMKSAWVITREGPRHSTEVIGILSSRKSVKDIKAHLEWFYALLHCSPHAHLNCARYRNPEVPYEAEYGTTNTGIPVGSLLRCGDNPYLVARLAKNVSLVDVSEYVSILKWTEPDRLVCDAQTPPM